MVRDNRWHKENRAWLRKASMLSNARDRSRKKGLEFTITHDDIVVPEFCPILGIKLEHGFQTGRDNSPSLDRMDLSKGYTPDNIQVISYLANRMKNNATLEQCVLLGEWANKILTRT